MFNSLPDRPYDPLFHIMAQYRADTRTHKMDLGVGVYCTAEGKSPVMAAVAAAEEIRLRTQTTKKYMSLRGDERFLETMVHLTLGDMLSDETRLASIQTVGSTSGLALAFRLLKEANPKAKVLIGVPAWPLHETIARACDLEVARYDYFDRASQTLQFENLLNAVETASSGDVLLLQGPCHNPSGEDMSEDRLTEILNLADSKGLVLLADAAYYGFGDGLDNDLARVRKMLSGRKNALIAMSCSKAFGLYRERTGVLLAITEDKATTFKVQRNLEIIARNIVSMPPAHGAAIVGEILSDLTLTEVWRQELAEMCARVKTVRTELDACKETLTELTAIARQKGFFSLLPITPETTRTLAEDHAIYMPASGRINVAGFKAGEPQRFCTALADALQGAAPV